MLHILDDFFTAEPTLLKCLTGFSTLIRVTMSLQASVVASKTLGPSQELECMGIVLDSIRMEARLPPRPGNAKSVLYPATFCLPI